MGAGHPHEGGKRHMGVWHSHEDGPPTHFLVGVHELCPGISRQHVKDHHLSPFIYVN